METDKFRIGGTYISCTNLQDAKRRISLFIKKGKKGYVCVSNPRTVKIATRKKDYRRVMEQSLMNLPDAEPMLWAAQLWGLKEVERTMGPMLFKEMILEKENGLRHFLLGDTEDTLSKLILWIKEHKGGQIAGSFSPPFCDVDDFDYESISQMINESNANIIWISMRAPKQDFFSYKIVPYLRDGIVCIGVGAAFRFTLGEYRIAPKIIKKMGLMGLYWGKKSQSWPAFIWGYFYDNVPYLFYLLAIPIKRIVGRKYNE